MDENERQVPTCRTLVGWYTHFLVEFDILDNFEGKSKVAKQYVYAQEPDETEIAQHMIERQRAVIAHDLP
jgi:hypothetical protein